MKSSSYGSSLSPAALQRLDQVCDRFEAAWQAGQRPRIEDFLGETAGPERTELLRELLLLEWEKGSRQGQAISCEDYCQRFPEQRDLVQKWFQARKLQESSAAVPQGKSSVREARWFLAKGKKKLGPFTLAQMREQACKGQLSATDMVLPEGASKWVEAGSIAELFAGPRKTAAGTNSPETVDAPPGDFTRTYPPASDPPPPTKGSRPLPTLPGYEIMGEIGQGGMGVVYKARQTQLKRVVALKMISSGAMANAEEVDRFRVEAEAVARLQHPNIVQIFEVGEHEGRPFFSLEFLEGGSLNAKLAGNPQPPRDAARLVVILARALHAAHHAGIVHRDLKPANVLLTLDGTPKVADFGLAKLTDAEEHTRTGAILGTPSYMAPEQALGRIRQIGPATDVYALGVILYEMLTGRPPFRGTEALDTLDQVRHQLPVSPRRLQPKTPRDLETICLKCLEKDSRRRYATAQELGEDLERFLEGKPIRARPLSVPGRTWRWCRRHPVVAGSMALVLVALLSFVFYWQTRPAYLDIRAEPPTAEVYLDGTLLSLVEGRALATNGPGQHQVSVRATGHLPQEHSVNLIRGRDNALLLKVHLESDFGYFQAATTPSGATVRVYDTQNQFVVEGTTPYNSGRLPSGAYRLEFKLGLYEDAASTVTVPTGDRLAKISAVPLKPAEGATENMALIAFLKETREGRWKVKDLHHRDVSIKEALGLIHARHQFPCRVNEASLKEANPDVDLNSILTSGIEPIPPGDYSPQQVFRRLCKLPYLGPALREAEGAPRADEVGYVPALFANKKYGFEIVNLDRAHRQKFLLMYPLEDYVDDQSNWTEAARTLIDAITRNVAPGTWFFSSSEQVQSLPAGAKPPLPVRGPVNIQDAATIRYSPAARALMVRHSWLVQEEVYAHLKELRLAKLALANTPVPKLESESQILLELLRLSAAPREFPEIAASTPVEKFCGHLHKLTGCRIEVHPEVKRDLSFDRKRSIPRQEERRNTLTGFLQRVLVPMELSYVPVKGPDSYGLQIVSRSMATAKRTVVVYAIKDFISGPDRLDAKVIQGMITSRVGLDVWARNPGTKFTDLGKALQIEATWQVHEAIALALDDLRQARQARSHRVLRGHSSPVVHVAFSPDGTRLVSSARDPNPKFLDEDLILWERAQGKTRSSWKGSSPVFDPRGMLLFSSGMRFDGTFTTYVIRAWNTETAGRNSPSWEYRFKDSPQGLMVKPDGNFLACSPDGKLLACAGLTTITLLDAQSGREMQVLKAPGKPLWGACQLAFGEDSRQLISLRLGEGVLIWHLAIGQPTTTLKDWASPTSFAVQPKGKLLAVVDQRGSVNLWDKETESWDYLIYNPFPQYGITAAAFSPDGQYLACVAPAGGFLHCWKVATAELVFARLGHSFRSVAWSPDSRWLATGCNDGTVKIWEASFSSAKPGPAEPVNGQFTLDLASVGKADLRQTRVFVDGKLLPDWQRGQVLSREVGEHVVRVTSAGQFIPHVQAFTLRPGVQTIGPIILHPPPAKPYQGQGKSNFQLGKYSEAIEDFSQALEFDPKDIVSRAQRADAYARLGRARREPALFDKGIEDCSTILQSFPRHIEAYRLRGLIRAWKGDHDLAIVDCNKVIELNPKDSRAYNIRGWVHFNKKELAKAIADYDRAIELDPKNVQAYFDRGLAHEKNGDQAKAKADRAKAHQLQPKQFPNNPQTGRRLPSLGWRDRRDSASRKA